MVYRTLAQRLDFCQASNGVRLRHSAPIHVRGSSSSLRERKELHSNAPLVTDQQRHNSRTLRLTLETDGPRDHFVDQKAVRIPTGSSLVTPVHPRKANGLMGQVQNGGQHSSCWFHRSRVLQYARCLSATSSLLRATGPAQTPAAIYGIKQGVAIPQVRIVEVSPRDGLQNEEEILSLDDKIAYINMLETAGLSTIEIASFVNPAKVPQMADAAALTRHFCPRNTHMGSLSPRFQVLVANMRGFEEAAEAGAQEISVFTATTDAFCKANINTTVSESLKKFSVIAREAADRGIKTRGYVSCIFECPYQGTVAPTTVVQVARHLLDMGCYEVSLGDTLGAGTAGQTLRLMEELHRDNFPMEAVAMHLHDTYGQALANILLSVVHGGVRVVDTAVAGLGGCPFASTPLPTSARWPDAGAATAAAAAAAAAKRLMMDAKRARSKDGTGEASRTDDTSNAVARVTGITEDACRLSWSRQAQAIYPRVAPGNVSTEDVVYMLEKSGVKTVPTILEFL
ncbi:Hydroxymethylglutaryl-CoA lyase,related [Neospora caninum Liverpool]|uniref:hydroxymethylglutaryl-CoA lyase n=1 Tax=Neospora caninum (strain Liverpool) TaxID=572307 RepID=F0VEZ8_NEOCL|nr:Hydroxymethylglutaryl-CoA lyase,related [Neospora caninum Liverpool]CBZ52292.1 Hydroxymethylglutaryl-CoA lyase,related [Neospora caninum Liverpool]|eukprot:XP_003882324.1 Hydroxymethylglutaryl-CoA lyase,related [Neospora caninum Liverpool]